MKIDMKTKTGILSVYSPLASKVGRHMTESIWGATLDASERNVSEKPFKEMRSLFITDAINTNLVVTPILERRYGVISDES